MSSTVRISQSPAQWPVDPYQHERLSDHSSERPFVSVVVPAYNEAAILEDNLNILCDYLHTIETQYSWEIVLVNDGSRDNTGSLAELAAQQHPGINVVHHRVNQGLGQALKTGFEHCRGQYIVTLDLDLSYAPEHIEQLLQKIQATQAKVVVISPYMPGGKVSNVPWSRLMLSVWANRFLSLAAKRDTATLTGMVRAYEASFIKSLSFRSTGMDVNPEILYKARMLKVPIVEIPGHLCWRNHSRPHTRKAAKPARRKSSMKILRHSWSVVFYGFIFRPVMFFVLPGLMLSLGAAYVFAHIGVHCLEAYGSLPPGTGFSELISYTFVEYPHDYFLGMITLILAFQFLSLGLLAMQMKHYFEESFFLGTQINKSNRS
ncbi:glycosyltransferase family 2 protein [Leptothoe spongobia TAU-MAC 1115]|uniref:Glycosyltransferase family 2 protein n=1 Tax=Leptothoe spongobia TAU-MAC 1115 TaxID=1967444 RepID=A0A947DI43_9CYAN|nr:glycosyltransferase family 2 protein [Leptothoe spongobia TAU-MAC 1115]